MNKHGALIVASRRSNVRLLMEYPEYRGDFIVNEAVRKINEFGEKGAAYRKPGPLEHGS